MYALGRTSIGTGDRIGCPGQANPKYGTAFAKEAAAQIKLRGARIVRYSLVNARPIGTPQSYVGVVR